MCIYVYVYILIEQNESSQSFGTGTFRASAVSLASRRTGLTRGGVNS